MLVLLKFMLVPMRVLKYMLVMKFMLVMKMAMRVLKYMLVLSNLIATNLRAQRTQRILHTNANLRFQRFQQKVT
jgi:hypothetical protein